MFYASLIELDALFSIILIIVFALYSLKSTLNLDLGCVYMYCRILPLIYVAPQISDKLVESYSFGSLISETSYISTLNNGNIIDVLLALLLFVIMASFSSFESVLLLLFAFIAQYFMLHSIDLLTFYIALEAQNFCFLVLCGLSTTREGSSFSVEAALKFMLLSAFSSGVILFWFSTVYLQTGLSILDNTYIQSFSFLVAIMFKIGAAPLHLWVIQIYSSVKRGLLMYVATAPKLSLFGWMFNSFHGLWTVNFPSLGGLNYSVLLFAAFSLVLGSLGAYSQPTLRALFAYSTVNELGLMLMAMETAGFHSLFQHLGLYIIAQVLLWNMYDKRFFTIVAVSLAGLPPLAGFFGKAWIFWHTGVVGLYTILAGALFCTVISLVYYLRVLRLFWDTGSYRVVPMRSLTETNSMLYSYKTPILGSRVDVIPTNNRVMLTSVCTVLLIFLPLFVIKPFIL
uniref:NADH dehydrogenase subunit 2 n=1 Tax=Chlorogonium elongatum TaxID=52029 RepID=O79869_9CHLO|nr:NADH dehydrogenase subunit 2 [Chlorogonium elongatum]